jgi:hypothetical protein
MNMQEALKQPIEIHWWNMESKQLDYRGDFRGYLRKKEIRFKKCLHGYAFDIAVSGMTVQAHMTCGEPVSMLEEAVVLFLTMMQDKATLHSRHLRRINW